MVLDSLDRDVSARRGAEMEHRDDRHARDHERQHRRGMMVAYRHDIRPGLIDAAVDHALGDRSNGFDHWDHCHRTS